MKQVGEFVLMNDEKVNRAIHGTLSRLGQLSGGVGDSATEAQLLAEYDRLGGHITKNGLKVKMGSFYDFKARKAHAEPQVAFIIHVDGDNVEGTEEEAEALKSARDRIKQIKARKNKGAEGALPTGATTIFTPEEQDEMSEPKTKQRGKK